MTAPVGVRALVAAGFTALACLILVARAEALELEHVAGPLTVEFSEELRFVDAAGIPGGRMLLAE